MSTVGMKNDTLVSVIVPVYNTERYLDKCVQSIVEQSHEALEILLIDDGSTDSSADICDTWAKKDGRIKVIHKKNGGAADAKNCGIDNTKGEYVMFVDSDDYIDKNMCALLLDIVTREGADIAMCNFFWVKDDGMEEQRARAWQDGAVLPGEAVMMAYLLHYSTDLGVLWNKLIKRDLFFSQNRPRFPTELKTSEDKVLACRLYLASRRVAYTRASLYYYVRRDDALHNSDVRRMFCDRATSLAEIYEMSAENERLKECADVHLVREYFAAAVFVRKAKINDRREIMRPLRHLLLQNVAHIWKNKRGNWKLCVKYALIRLGAL